MDLKTQCRKQKVKGLFVKLLDNPAYSIMAQQAGFDFIFYDREHGVIPYEKLHDLILMGNALNLPSIVRVAQLARADVSQILDCGASGVMVPMIETAEQARQLVSWSKYPPIGNRSYSGGANTNYAPSGNHASNMEQLNAKTMTIVQIETVKGVENIHEILALEGVDAAIVGPCDLGISMNNPDNVMDERELAMIQKVADACAEHDKLFAIIGGMNLQEAFIHHVDLLISAIDTNLLKDGFQKAVKGYDDLIRRYEK